MIRSNFFLFATLLSVMAINVQCSSSNQETKVKASKVESNKDVPEPCDILSEAFLKKHFNIDTPKINRLPSKYSPHPHCSVNWRKKNADEIEAAYGIQIQEYLSDKMAGKDVKVPIQRSDNLVSLTLNKNRSESKEAGELNFESAMKILREGMTVKVKDTEVTTKKRETIPVNGVGDKAMWVPSLSQISVLAKNQIFHVTVETGNEETDKEKASIIAKEIISML